MKATIFSDGREFKFRSLFCNGGYYESEDGFYLLTEADGKICFQSRVARAISQREGENNGR